MTNIIDNIYATITTTGHVETDQATTADLAFFHEFGVDDKREPRKWPWSWSGDAPTDGGFEPAVQNTHIVAGRRTKKNAKYASRISKTNICFAALWADA